VNVVINNHVSTGLTVVDELSENEHIHKAISNCWIFVGLVSQVKEELLLDITLSIEEGSEVEWELVMVCEVGNGWLKHSIEDLVSEEIHRILDYDQGKSYPLVKTEGNPSILMVDLGLSKFQTSCPQDWLEESSLSSLKFSVKASLHILNVKDKL
jgi:hypothetical protein